jgi:hypothetical protein
MLSQCLPRTDPLDQRERIAWAMFWWAIRRLYGHRRGLVWRYYRLNVYRLAGVAAYDVTLLAFVMDDFIGEHIRFKDGSRPDSVAQFEQRLREGIPA